ncbi:MAG: T9SS type A sorting domain-containing protein [Bacteroidales bacterium]|nr:T9SS type A sorting domain-containing protein [Bacteroidales bacterium]MBN2763600.1 T9SS type A sorting domain-containing protein [Bacteroidales bacterium]
MTKKILLYSFLPACIFVQAQYAPPAGENGSTAIHKDSSVFIAWATYCHADRGYIKLTDTTLAYEGYNRATQGTEEDATGPADGIAVSLGDAGEALLSFSESIADGEGPDFAVFENGFPAMEPPGQYFLELAFVEVSSDGNHFVRFPAFSNTPASPQVKTFDQLDPTLLHNLAGKYTVNYGVPFDLDDLKDSTGIDIHCITHIKIVDVVGMVHPDYARCDSRGLPVNDPWPTPFNSGGFDLDAMGIIHTRKDITNAPPDIAEESLRVFPNPVKAGKQMNLVFEDEPWLLKEIMITIFDISGKNMLTKELVALPDLMLTVPSELKSGVYILVFRSDNRISRRMIRVDNRP